MSTAEDPYVQQLSNALPSLAPPVRLAAMISGAGGAPAPAGVTSAVQVVRDVPIAWNWPPTSAGAMNLSLFEFCDTIPVSCDDGAPFFGGSDSFSDNYQSFVNSIASGGSFDSLVRAAAARVAMPAAGALTTPPGWARVYVNGLAEWRPVWSPESTPDDWIASVATGDDEPRTIQFDLASPAPSLFHTSDASVETLLSSSVRSVAITAKAWGRIAVAPGNWFDSTLVSLAAQGVRLRPWTSSLLFGPQGLLRYRITEFFVAYEPEFSINVSSDTVNQVTNAIAAVKQFVIGGIAFAGGAASVASHDQPNVTSAGARTVIAGRSASPYPQIVAVVVTPLAVPLKGT